jgi:hypothetical protein
MRVQDEVTGRDVGEDHDPLGMPGQRCAQPIQLATGHQGVLAPQGVDDPLAHPPVLAHTLDEIEVAMASGGFLADKHQSGVRTQSQRIKENMQKQRKCSTTQFPDRQKSSPVPHFINALAGRTPSHCPSRFRRGRPGWPRHGEGSRHPQAARRALPGPRIRRQPGRRMAFIV